MTFALDRSGLVGEDGPTHSGNYDIAFLRCIPNMVICTPSDENETRKLLSTAYFYNGPATVRYPRGTGPNKTIEKELKAFEIGKANVVTDYGSKIVILNFGALLEEACSVAKDLQITLIDMRFVKPLDEELLKKYLTKADMFVSIEDGSVWVVLGVLFKNFVQEKILKLSRSSLAYRIHLLNMHQEKKCLKRLVLHLKK